MLAPNVAPARITEVFERTKQFDASERLLLAKLLLDSVLNEEAEADTQWNAMSLDAFTADWDNPEDAIYDNWREAYGLSER